MSKRGRIDVKKGPGRNPHKVDRTKVREVKREVTPSSLRRKISLAVGAVLSICGLSLVAYDISQRAKKALTPSSSQPTLSIPRDDVPVSRDTVSKDTTDSTLFMPAEKKPDIPRADIPKNLQNLIGEFGKVVYSSKEYDPTKPNLYLLGAAHVETASGQYNRGAYETQDEILRIFHLLYSIGVKRQFLEGIPTGEIVQHDVDSTRYGETPMRSMPQYRGSGKIKRAYIAAEGIYGDAIESVGVDIDLHEFTRITNEYIKFDEEEFPKILKQVIEGVCKDFGINFNYDFLENDPNALMRLEQLAKERINLLNDEEIKKLAEKHVLNNPLYQRWLQIAVEYFYMRIERRDDAFVRGIREAGRSEKRDAVFIVGAQHSPGILEQLERDGDYNLFFIVPHSIFDPKIISYLGSYRRMTREEYRQDIIATDLFGFGLGPESRNPIANF